MVEFLALCGITFSLSARGWVWQKMYFSIIMWSTKAAEMSPMSRFELDLYICYIINLKLRRAGVCMDVLYGSSTSWAEQSGWRHQPCLTGSWVSITVSETETRLFTTQKIFYYSCLSILNSVQTFLRQYLSQMCKTSFFLNLYHIQST